jgi:hypothetical protein
VKLTNLDLSSSITREIGNVELEVKLEQDTDPCFDYLGEFSNMNWNPVTGIYHRRSKLMYDGTRWRTETGGFAPEPELEVWGCGNGEYQFIDIGDCQFNRGDKNWLKYAFQNAKRLDTLDENWIYVGIVATVYLHGIEIGSASVWGFDYEYWDREQNKYLADEAKSILAEAIAEAKKFVGKVKKVA